MCLELPFLILKGLMREQRYIWRGAGDQGGLLIEEVYACIKVRSFDTSEAGTPAWLGGLMEQGCEEETLPSRPARPSGLEHRGAATSFGC